MKQIIDINGKTILITGAAGFIGYHLTKRLLNELDNSHLIGIDNFNDYYDVKLKQYRNDNLKAVAEHGSNTYEMIVADIADKKCVEDVFNKYNPEIVINLAAQAGVRYSIYNPDAYISSNIIGFYNILEAVRHSYDDGKNGVEHLVYASSSSVYGGNKKVPFSTDDMVDSPVSLYAATKKSDELLAHAYSKLYDIPMTGLRFFTVYGPAGRPDMAYFSFTDKLRQGADIDIFNYGKCKRDFTYVDDIVEGIIRVIKGAPKRAVGEDELPIPPHAIYNIGGGLPVKLLDFVKVLYEEMLSAGIIDEDFKLEEHLHLVPMQPGDVEVTYADTSQLELDYGFCPKVDLRTGLKEFVQWYKAYYKL